MRIFTRQEIEKAVRAQDVMAALEDGFVAYSRGEVNTPPVGYLKFDAPPGDLHIKYGHRRGDDEFVIKIASGFYDNPRLGLSSGNGMMIVLSARTGAPIATLASRAGVRRARGGHRRSVARAHP